VSSSASFPLLQGEVRFDEQTESFSDATMYVYLNDTTMADEPAKRVLTAEVQNVGYDATVKNRPTFSLYGVLPRENADYTVRVIVDLDKDGKAGPGDFINSESYPVLTRGWPDTVSIRVKQLQ
jgi:hypothetical protein